MSSRNLNQIESIRGIAALMVAVFHFTYFQGLNSKIINNQTILNSTYFGQQGVELFYIISGFIIPFALNRSTYKLSNFFRYFLKRILRLYPPYIITIALIVFVNFFFAQYIWKIGFDFPIKQTLTNIFFLSDLFPDYGWINPIFATLEVEFQFYILIGLIFPFLNKNNIQFLLTILTLLFVGVITREYDTVFVNMPYFGIGILLYQIKSKGISMVNFMLMLVITSLLIIYYQNEDIWIALIGFGLLLYLPEKTRFLKYTGKISYSFYLLHGLAGGQFLYLTQDLSIWKNHPYVMILFAILISWICAFCMYHLVEKSCLKIASRIKYR